MHSLVEEQVEEFIPSQLMPPHPDISSAQHGAPVMNVATSFPCDASDEVEVEDRLPLPGDSASQSDVVVGEDAIDEGMGEEEEDGEVEDDEDEEEEEEEEEGEWGREEVFYLSPPHSHSSSKGLAIGSRCWNISRIHLFQSCSSF